jgi:hypothetical protein
MSIVRYVQMNMSNLVLKRRRFFMWFVYEPFDNRLREKEAKLNKLYDEFVKVHQEHRDLLAEKNRIHKEILDASHCEAHHGPIFKMKTKFFRPAVLPPVDDRWVKFSKVLRGGGTMGDFVAATSDRKTVLPTSDMVGNAGETIGSVSMPIRRQNTNNNKQQNNQQKGQQQSQGVPSGLDVLGKPQQK